jgi:hypothetical protein
VVEEGYDDLDEYNQDVLRLRNERTCDTYYYAGDFVKCVNNEHEDVGKNWASLPRSERRRRWVDNFRMFESEFDAYLPFVKTT